MMPETTIETILPEPEWPTQPVIEEAVKTEARRLDRLFPDWAERVNIHTLDLLSGKHCILGQAAYQQRLLVFKQHLGYGGGIVHVHLDSKVRGEDDLSTCAYYTNAARTAWIDEVLARR
jgi:hypothetical protein